MSYLVSLAVLGVLLLPGDEEGDEGAEIPLDDDVTWSSPPRESNPNQLMQQR
jgi:hypothetical protein